jgi:hypothetical protein
MKEMPTPPAPRRTRRYPVQSKIPETAAGTRDHADRGGMGGLRHRPAWTIDVLTFHGTFGRKKLVGRNVYRGAT